MNAKTKRNHTRNLAVTALLFAVIVILTYMQMKIGVIEMTLRMIPVVLGGILLGPAYGALLGGFFGLTSFFECYGILGMPLSSFGMFMVGLDPYLTAVMCFVPRIIMGFLSALLYKGIAGKNRYAAHAVANVSGAVLNTVLFMSALILLFWKNPAFIAQMNGWGLATDNLWLFIVAFVGINGVVEAAVCAFLGTAVSVGVEKATGFNGAKR